ncbi:MAG: methenyltetrahydromethanopterin cyclohydrolase [Gammaproteobacteria bacterium]
MNDVMKDEQFISINGLAGPLVQSLIADAASLRLLVSKLENGATIVDAGIESVGSLEAGRRIAGICLGGLGTVRLRSSANSERWPWHVDVHASNPVLACLASQYAGWSLSHGHGKRAFHALGSGPARALGSKEPLFEEIAYRDKADSTCLVLEVDTCPPVEIAREVAEKCHVAGENLTLILTPTSSLSGIVQIVSRVLETALHKAHALGFPLEKIVDGAGSAPLCPPAGDFLTAMGRTNDAILFAGHVQLFVDAGDVEAAELANRLPSSASEDFGKPFGEIFKEVNYDFYKIDPMLFSPASVTVSTLKRGKSYHAGRINPELLDRSFTGDFSC